MKILVTGSRGFVGRNLVSQLHNIRDGKARNYGIAGEELAIYEYDMDSDPAELDVYCKQADFVFNLAGVNRPQDASEFMKGNFGFASNVFGKWCRPNYNSAVATFCNNIAHDQPIRVNDPSVVMHLVYIDDVVDELISALSGMEHRNGDYCEVPVVHTITLGGIVELIRSFRQMPGTLSVPDLSDAFTKKLYSTYLSYLPEERFSYPLKMNVDDRGSFTEIIRTSDRGQFSVNISKPGVTKGQHWHHTKNEKFVVVSGHGLIQLRKIGTEEVVSFEVSGGRMEVVEMIPGYTHNIVNLSETEDLVTFMWCNECFDPARPDTYFEKV